MRVIYGSSIPPSVEGETKGEVRLRVEKLILQKAEIRTPLPEIADLEACTIEPVWWGGDRSGAKRTPRCTPSTNDTARGVSVFAFPSRTLRPQLETYFAHMDSADSGLMLRVVLPASASGTGREVAIGVASVRVDGLSPKHAVGGWFTIVSAESSETIIGRVKLHLSVNYFETSLPPKHQDESPAGKPKPKLSQRAHVDPPTMAKELPPQGGQLAPPGGIPPPLHQPGYADHRVATIDPSLPTGTHVQQQSAFRPDPPSPPAAAAILATEQPSPNSGLPELSGRIDAMFRRGFELRSAMLRASSRGNDDRASNSAARLERVFHVPAAGARETAPSLLDPIRFQLHDDDDDFEAVSTASRASSTVSTSHDDEMYEEMSTQREPTRVHHAAPSTSAPMRPPPAAQQFSSSPVAVATHRLINDPCSFVLTLMRVSVASEGPVGACQFAMRFSRDVLFPSPPQEPVWSPRFALPVDAAAGEFRVPVAAYTTSSRVVLECFLVHRDGANMTLAGIGIVSLLGAASQVVEFRNPATSTIGAQAEISITKRPLTEVAAAHHEGAQSRVENQAEPEPVVITSAPASRLVASPPHADGTQRHGAMPIDHHDDRYRRAAQPATPHMTMPTLHFAHTTEPRAEPAATWSAPRFVMELAVTGAKGIPKVSVLGQRDAFAPRLVIAVGELISTDGHCFDEWACETDCWVAPPATEKPPVPALRTILNVAGVKKDLARLTLKVMAWTSPREPPFIGNGITTEELVVGCIDVGTVEIDLRPHTRFNAPPTEGWYHLRAAGANIGQLMARCVVG
jgi:hypothetical protein